MIRVFGSLNYDLVTTTDAPPAPGETKIALDFQTFHGGKGANQCRAIRRLLDPNSPLSVSMFGSVGDDEFGRELVRGLDSENVNVSLVQVLSDSRTGIAAITVDAHTGQNSIMVYSGANSRTALLASQVDILKECTAIVLQNEIPQVSVYNLIKLAPSFGVPTFYNPSPVFDKGPPPPQIVDYLVVNSSEAWDLCRIWAQADATNLPETNVDAHLALLSQLRPFAKTVVITLGAHGCVYYDSKVDSAGHVAAAPVAGPVVDTTGAGDTFLGGLVASVCSGSSLPEALKFASRAAAVAITRPGAAQSIPRYQDVKSAN